MGGRAKGCIPSVCSMCVCVCTHMCIYYSCSHSSDLSTAAHCVHCFIVLDQLQSLCQPNEGPPHANAPRCRLFVSHLTHPQVPPWAGRTGCADPKLKFNFSASHCRNMSPPPAAPKYQTPSFLYLSGKLKFPGPKVCLEFSKFALFLP